MQIKQLYDGLTDVILQVQDPDEGTELLILGIVDSMKSHLKEYQVKVNNDQSLEFFSWLIQWAERIDPVFDRISTEGNSSSMVMIMKQMIKVNHRAYKKDIELGVRLRGIAEPLIQEMTRVEHLENATEADIDNLRSLYESTKAEVLEDSDLSQGSIAFISACERNISLLSERLKCRLTRS